MGILRSANPARFEPRLVWIFGSPRSGSTWLLRMLAEHARVSAINEPLIGVHLAPFFPDALSDRPVTYPQLMAERDDYFFSERHRETWEALLRELILTRLGVAIGKEPLAIVKEPNGSQAAPTIMSLLPRSRMVLLVRDGRDVVDSELAAYQPDAWMGRVIGLERPPPRKRVIEYSAGVWLARIEAVERAYQVHPEGLRYRLTYEQLREDPGSCLQALFDWLELPTPVGLVDSITSRHEFEQVRRRGERSFARAAKPGLWRENLDSSERDLLEDLLGPKLRELGYDEN